MKTERHQADRFWAGLLAGIVGTALGGVMLGFWWAWANGSSFSYFYHEIVRSSLLYRDSILTASTLFNVVLFWGANRLGWERFAQGLLAVILVTVPFIVYFQSSAGTW
ncbi:MAG: hypothetical protein O2990_04615 [Bacteroidetes bacterium]|nr:hypothetical protein [Bacteroidota bacterium]